METGLDFSSTFHPQTDGQSEWTISILEDMPWAFVLDLEGNLITHLPLVEFAHNNSFYSSIGMAHMKLRTGKGVTHLYIGMK